MDLRNKKTEELLDFMALVASRAVRDMNRAIPKQHGIKLSLLMDFNRHIRTTDDVLLNQALETLKEIGTELNTRRKK